MEPSALLDTVEDADTFLEFARVLEADRRESAKLEAASPSSPYGPDAKGWENVTIEDFLESAIAWAEDTKFGITQGLEPQNPWKQLATFLYCGKVYE